MKKAIIMMIMVVGTLVAGCTNQQTKGEVKQEEKKDVKQETVYVDPEYEGAPKWVTEDEMTVDVIRVSGSAKITSSGISFAETKAMADARRKMAESIATIAKSSFEGFTNEVGIEGEESVDKVSKQVFNNLSKAKIENSIKKATWISKTKTLYVLVEYDKKIAMKEAKKQIKSSMESDKAIWQMYLNEVNQKKLDESIDKEFSSTNTQE